jgi:tRNA splicing endonuclease
MGSVHEKTESRALRLYELRLPLWRGGRHLEPGFKCGCLQRVY